MLQRERERERDKEKKKKVYKYMTLRFHLPVLRIPDTRVPSSSRNIFIQAAPKDPSGVMVRPEVRGRYSGTPEEFPASCQQLFAPGNALLEPRPLRGWSYHHGKSYWPTSNSQFHDGIAIN